MQAARVLSLLLLSTTLAAQAPPPAYDIVIRNGRVLDGAYNPWITDDVAILNGHFVKIGVRDRSRTPRERCHWQVRSPGWIDMMDQSGETLLVDGLADNKVREGVTTVVAGEGGTPVPADQIAGYLNKLQPQGISVNFGTYFSEEQARVAVLGQSERAPSPGELDQMKSMMAAAMRGGAMGMTTALIYPPGRYAKTDELVAVASVAGQYGGNYASHMRGEGKEVVQSVDELIEISDRAHLPAEIFHLKVAYQPGWGKLMQQVGEEFATARARDLEIAGDLYLYTAGGTGLDSVVPAGTFEGDYEQMKQRLHDPAIRAPLKQEQLTGAPGWWNIVEAAGGWDGIVLVDAQNPVNAKYQGKSIAAIAREMHIDPPDAAFKLIEQGLPKQCPATLACRRSTT